MRSEVAPAAPPAAKFPAKNFQNWLLSTPSINSALYLSRRKQINQSINQSINQPTINISAEVFQYLCFLDWYSWPSSSSIFLLYLLLLLRGACWGLGVVGGVRQLVHHVLVTLNKRCFFFYGVRREIKIKLL